MPLLALHRTQTDPLLRKSPQQCSPIGSPSLLPDATLQQLAHSTSLVQSRRNTHLFDAARMATAKFKNHLHGHHAPRLFRHNSYTQAPVNEEQRQKEREFICCFDCNSAPLTPNEICESNKGKELGCTSKNIRIEDFDLLKTIGTGTSRLVLAHPILHLHETNASHQEPSRGCGSPVSPMLQRTTRKCLR